MSEEKVEIVREVLDSLQQSARTGTATAALLARCDQKIRVDATTRVFNPDFYEGPAGVGRLVREMHDTWDGFSYVSRRLLEAGEKVLSLHSIVGKGRYSGVEVSAESALLFSLRGGLIVHVVAFTQPAEALKAAGLEE